MPDPLVFSLLAFKAASNELMCSVAIVNTLVCVPGILYVHPSSNPGPMHTEKPLVNRVAQSGLKVIDMEAMYPEWELASLDIKAFLFQGLILKEKDFRAAIKEVHWADYSGKILCVFCSADAIIPVWAYMLVATYAQPFVHEVFGGDEKEFLRLHYNRVVSGMNIAAYENERVILKGCGSRPVPSSAYLALASRLRPVAKSIMYGEPCSTVPIFKQPARQSAQHD